MLDVLDEWLIQPGTQQWTIITIPQQDYMETKRHKYFTRLPTEVLRLKSPRISRNHVSQYDVTRRSADRFSYRIPN